MRPFLSSLARISDLDSVAWQPVARPRSDWQTGDYVLGRVVGKPGRQGAIELGSGRVADVSTGDRVVGALGVRYATLEMVGDWHRLQPGEDMQILSAAGLVGKMTSMSNFLPSPVVLEYEGHVHVRGEWASMKKYVPPMEPRELACPVLAIIGTSMSSGKTSTARVLIRRLVEQGKRVVGAKLTGTGRYRDTLAMVDSGVVAAIDFVDAGLPSTVCPEDEYCRALEQMLTRIAGYEPDVLVAEIGASPMEPYNGSLAIEALEPRIRCMALCASDPFGVVGVIQAYRRRPDFVAGVATSTEAGIRLVNRLTNLPAVNVFDPNTMEKIDILLERCWQ